MRTRFAATAARAAVAGGCGSSDDKGPSKAEFIKQADAICKGDEDKVKAITDGAAAATEKVEANPALGAEEGAKDPFAKTNKLAKDYGLKACGSS